MPRVLSLAHLPFDKRMRGISDHGYAGGNVLRHDGAGADNGVPADRDAGQDDGPRADGGAVLDDRLQQLASLVVDTGTRIEVVAERRVGADEDIAADEDFSFFAGEDLEDDDDLFVIDDDGLDD